MQQRFSGTFRGLIPLVCLVTGILCTPEYKISWEEASRQCKTKYESELITYQCIGDLNLTAEIIKELGINVEAWIDGKVSDLGCTRDACYRIKQEHTREETRNPVICVHLGSFKVQWTEVTYEKAKVICGSAQHKMEDVRIDITRLQNDFKKPTAFWVPGVSLDSTRDQCTSVVSRDNETLEMRQANCSFPKIGICINTSYIADHQMSTFLEINPLSYKEEVLSVQAYMQEDVSEAYSLQLVGARSVDNKGGHIWELKTLLPFVFSVFNLILFMVLMGFMLVLWKRVTSKWNMVVKNVHPLEVKRKSRQREKEKKIFKNTEYQCVPALSPANSTRVKILPEEENLYSEITGKGACFNDEVNPVGNGYVDMKGMPGQMRNGAYCSSFRLGKSPSTQMDSTYC
ncbi:uncharacterized protein LOC128192375 [Crassostrea angulata]|uniref:uncharacterized protein LOC128192375 n=1 Tax=Magallana angulata TaxID=2784310 RepID=UPI0022B1AA5D|nr:uncharacterized protein LOC128192375 [Crassostrea angulata]